MRHLIAILGVFAMLLGLAGPAAALAVQPCDEMAMAQARDHGPCETNMKACAAPCIASGQCQSQCGPVAAALPGHFDNILSVLSTSAIPLVGELTPPGTLSPVDGPPPRI